MPVAERLSLCLQRLAVQRLRAIQVALVLQQLAEVVDRDERVRVPVPERLSPRLQSASRNNASAPSRSP